MTESYTIDTNQTRRQENHYVINPLSKPELTSNMSDWASSAAKESSAEELLADAL